MAQREADARNLFREKIEPDNIIPNPNWRAYRAIHA